MDVSIPAMEHSELEDTDTELLPGEDGAAVPEVGVRVGSDPAPRHLVNTEVGHSDHVVV